MTKQQQRLIDKVAEIVKNRLNGESTGHDWWHVYRVWRMARHLNAKENANGYVVELASLLHDIADWKFNNHDESVGPQVAKKILQELHIEEMVIDQVCEIVGTISFIGSGEKNRMRSLEGMIVQDADRLDAMGAVGIARTFAYGGYAHRQLYDPLLKPSLHQNKQEYKNNTSPSINHFYEKLLLLKDRMNTATGRMIAESRHAFMEQYLNQFYAEWDGMR